MESENLPKLTQQQQNFLLQYFSNGKNASEAYRYAYNAEGTKNNTIWSEASKLLKNPKVTPWVEFYEANQQETIKNELNYSIQDAFEEFQAIQDLAIKSSKTYNVAMKAVENKAKLRGLYKEDNKQKYVQVNTMGSVMLDNHTLDLKVGKEVTPEAAE